MLDEAVDIPLKMGVTTPAARFAVKKLRETGGLHALQAKSGIG
ncbi:MAG: hypothetical protein ACI4WX_00695 [Aristaeellaceae bacterium]